jgi:hypothetical protein
MLWGSVTPQEFEMQALRTIGIFLGGTSLLVFGYVVATSPRSDSFLGGWVGSWGFACIPFAGSVFCAIAYFKNRNKLDFVLSIICFLVAILTLSAPNFMKQI